MISVKKDSWVYSIAYPRNKKPSSDGVSSCEFSRLFIARLIGFVVFKTLFICGYCLYAVVGSVIGILFASRVLTVKEMDLPIPCLKEHFFFFLINIKKWPTLFGKRILPITSLILFIACWLVFKISTIAGQLDVIYGHGEVLRNFSRNSVVFSALCILVILTLYIVGKICLFCKKKFCTTVKFV